MELSSVEKANNNKNNNLLTKTKKNKCLSIFSSIIILIIIIIVIVFFAIDDDSNNNNNNNNNSSSTFNITVKATTLANEVDALTYISEASEGYIPPTTNELNKWDLLLDEFFNSEWENANDLALELDYNLIYLKGGSLEGIYCLEEDENEVNGHGFYCFNPNATQSHHISAPHPIHDSDTRYEAVDVFYGVNAMYLSISTTHRCANSGYSSCDGTTSSCGTSEAYRESDMAHNVDTFFQDYSNKIYNSNNNSYNMQLHGCGNSTCPYYSGADIVVRISHGTTLDLANTTIVNLIDNELKTTVPLLKTGATTKSCSLELNDDDDKLCGTTNTQGRYINGETIDPCDTPATEFENSRFLHIEQNYDIRHDSSDDDVITSQVLIDAINAVFE